MNLLPRHLLVQTGPVDKADWNYRTLARAVQRRRFKLALALMGKAHFGRLLEVGYGSGVFMPELARRCDELFGIDIHERADDVAEALRRIRVTARLESASVLDLPFQTDTFDAVVSISTVEYVDPLPSAFREIARVLRYDGTLVVVTPARTPASRFAFRLANREALDSHYAGKAGRVIPALEQFFEIADRRDFPGVAGLSIYHAVRGTPRPT